MAAECMQAIARPENCFVVLTIAKGKMPKGFPRGELYNERTRLGIVERTYCFNAEKVLTWLVKNQLVVLRKTGERSMVIEAPNYK
jgi:hypothetical protein